MQTAFVTGAAGFLGTNLIEELLKQNWKVIAFHLPSDNLDNLSGWDVTCARGNILDYQSLLNAIPGDEEVTVFHLAGDTSMWKKHSKRQYEINVTGTAHVLRASLEKGVQKLVYTSSISAYGYHRKRVNETTRSNALTCRMNYNRTKYLAEQEVQKAVDKGLDAVILNPCNMMGPYDPRGWSTLIISMAEDRVPGVTRGTGTFAHVRDVARAHIKAAESGRRGENYLLGGREITFKDLYNKIGTLLQKHRELKTIPRPVFRLAMYLMRLQAFLKQEEPILTYPRYKRLTGRIVCNDAKARKELSFSTATISEMLQDSHAWLLKNESIK